MSVLRAPAGRRRSSLVWPAPPDAVTVLTVYALLLLVVPSDRSIGALGGAGSLASLFALMMLLWWCWHQVSQPQPAHGRGVQPVRLALFLFLASVLAGYAVASVTALPFVDSNGADLGLLRVAAFAGVLLVANDGIPDRERFLVLLRRLALFGGLYACLGLLQFATGQNFVDSIPIPGLSSSGTGGVDARAGFVRPEATARHALEYASVLSMLLPVALTLAIEEKHRPVLLRWFPAAAIALAAFLSVSRSALIGIAAALVVLVPTWQPAVRRAALWISAAGLVVIYFLVPGLLATILGMFSAQDSSVASRANGYDLAGEFIAMNPLLGRGFGTFLPTYRILDNQYLGLLIELGIAGFCTFAAIAITAMAVALRGRRGQDPQMRALGPSLCAAVLAGALLTAFFDTFSFPQAVGMLFLMAGICGAYWNLRPAAAGPGTSPPGGGEQ